MSDAVARFAASLKAQEERARANLYVVNGNPDQAARASILSRQTGLPADTVRRNLPEVERRVQAGSTARLVQQYPAIGRWAAKPQNAAIGRDDTDNLGRVAEAVGSYLDRTRPRPSAFQRLRRTISQGASNIGGSLYAGVAETNKGLYGLALNYVDLQERFDVTKGLQRKLFGGTMYDPFQRGIGGAVESSRNTAERYRPDLKPGLARDALQGIESVPASVTALALSLMGRPDLGLGVLGASTTGNSYIEGREAGLGEVQATIYGASQGAAEVGTEKIPVFKFFGDAQAGTPFFKRLMNNMISEQVGEQAATALQDLNTWAAIEANRGKTLADYIAERPDAALSTAVATTVGVLATNAGIGAVEQTAKRIDRAMTQRREAKLLDGLMKEAAESKVRQRDPEAFHEYIQQQAEGTAIENLFIPGETIKELYQSSDFDDGGFFSSYSEQIQEALTTGGDVVIPLADAASRLAGTPAWDAIRDDVRLSAGGLSAREAKTFDESLADEVAAMGDQVSALAEQERVSQEPRQKIAEAMRDKLMLAGYRPDVAENYAELVAARYATRASRFGQELTGEEAGDLEVRQVLPERLANVQAADQLDIVIQALKRGKAPASDRKRFGPSLLEFITQRGGIEDTGGDIESMGGQDWHKGKPGRRKLLRARPEGPDLLGDTAGNDNTPDALAMAAWEAGYFPNMPERPTVSDLLEAIGDELRGNARYAEDRSAITDEVRGAADELAALLDQQGVDAATASPKEIKEAVARYQAELEEGRAFDQSDMGPRGRIVFSTSGKSVIELFEQRDLSTFIHESGHLFLEELWADADRADAPDQLKADKQAVISWFKKNGVKMPKGGTIPTEAHELWARGFERFAMEGKAPSSALRRAFDAFKSWLLTIYKVVENLRSPVSPEIREVMERLIATDEEIEAARQEQNIKALFTSAAQAGMTEAEFAAYQTTTEESRNEAHDALLFRTMAVIRNQRTKWRKEEEAAVRAEVTARIDAQKEFRALAALRAKEPRLKLDRAELVETYGEDALSLLPSGVPPIYADKNTMSADGVAELNGFSSGDEMVRTLMGMEARRQEMKAAGDDRSLRKAMIDDETAAEMRDRHGDPLSDGSIEDEARALIHSDKQGEVIASELRALARRPDRRDKTKPTPYALAREWAKQKIAESVVNDALSGTALQRYEKAARKAGQLAEEAMLKGDVDETFRQKQAQMLNNALISEARKAKDIVDVAVRRLGKLARRATVKGLDQEYLDQAHDLLERYEFRYRSQANIREKEAFLDWVKSLEDEGLDLDIPPRLGDGSKHYSRMTVEELKGLDATVQQIVHLGRLKGKLLKAAEERRISAIAGRIRDAIHGSGGGGVGDLRTRNTPGAQFKAAGKKFLAMHRKMASLARQMDGRDGGPIWENMIRPMNASADMEAEMRAEATRKLYEITKAPLAEGKMGGKGIFFPHLGISLNREERIGIVANMGNAGNMQRLLDGEGWTREDLQPILESLSKADMDFVQAIWDLFESYRPLIGAKEKRVHGVEPEWIEPIPLDTPHGAYRGGYYPVKYDPRRSQRAEQHDDAEEAKRQMKGAYTSATTRRSFTKARAEEVHDRPLIYNLTGLYQGLNEVIHDLSWHEWLIDVNKLLRNGVIDGAMRTQYGPEAIGVFKSAIQDIAAGDVPAQNVFEGAINRVRMGATVAGLGWNLKTALLQPFGLTQSMVRIGPQWVARGLAQWFKAPFDMADEIAGKSTFMRMRAKTMQREINEIQNRITKGRSELRQFVEGSFFILIQKTQMTVDIPTWLGAYEKAIDAGNDEARSIALADQAVRDAQGGGQISDLAAIQRGGPLQKLFTNFYSFFNTTYNLTAESLARTDFRKPGDVMALTLDFLLLYSVPSAMGFLLAELFGAGDDDDSWIEGLIAENLSFMFGTMVGVREIAGAVQKALGVSQFDGAYGGPAGLRALQEADKLGAQIDQGEADRAFRKSMINTTGILFMLPSGQINKTWDGAEALIDDETDNPLVLVTGKP